MKDWEIVGNQKFMLTERIEIPEGWIYRSCSTIVPGEVSVVFVPRQVIETFVPSPPPR